MSVKKPGTKTSKAFLSENAIKSEIFFYYKLRFKNHPDYKHFGTLAVTTNCFNFYSISIQSMRPLVHVSFFLRLII